MCVCVCVCVSDDECSVICFQWFVIAHVVITHCAIEGWLGDGQYNN